ncbi:hypothetical protein GQX73_g2741 [Xylaria multiplex]|uniref:Uncharacterized protein n=1 Tax=Xylaria multiplex TaxID=323545 RepID=A0A7C8MVZ2_9PEZI|nr:hypothetical protein GQX73_g2741 [Xylaria multiplex]
MPIYNWYPNVTGAPEDSFKKDINNRSENAAHDALVRIMFELASLLNRYAFATNSSSSRFNSTLGEVAVAVSSFAARVEGGSGVGTYSSSLTSFEKTHRPGASYEVAGGVCEPEIIHLGGARVGTAFEVLDLPAPDRSKPVERPLTQWAFNPPPPNPPGIGIAIASPDDSPKGTHDASDFDTDRPITQWFPELKPLPLQEEKGNNQSRNLVVQTAYPYLKTNTTNAEEGMLSPLSPSSSSNATRNSPSSSVSPLRSPISSPVDPETNPSRSAQFPKRSTSLSQASRYAPQSAKRAVGYDAPLRAKEIQLRRTQSNAEVPRAVGWRDPSPHEPQIQEPQRETKSSPKPVMIIQDSQILPPLTSAPPNVPLPPISGTKLAGQGKARDQLHRRGRSRSGDRVNDRSPPIEYQEQADAQQSGAEPKLTPKERFWLHRHYRGEAMFLKAWGLQITSEEDREEGRGILRELMEREVQEEREAQERQHMHHRSASLSRSSTATASSNRDGAGLGVIAEERLSREFHFRPTESLGYTDGAEDKFWKVEHETADPGLRKHSGFGKHSRNESTDSVLGQYLDLRLSHNS